MCSIFKPKPHRRNRNEIFENKKNLPLKRLQVSWCQKACQTNQGVLSTQHLEPQTTIVFCRKKLQYFFPIDFFNDDVLHLVKILTQLIDEYTMYSEVNGKTVLDLITSS